MKTQNQKNIFKTDRIRHFTIFREIFSQFLPKSFTMIENTKPFIYMVYKYHIEKQKHRNTAQKKRSQFENAVHQPRKHRKFYTKSLTKKNSSKKRFTSNISSTSPPPIFDRKQIHFESAAWNKNGAFYEVIA